MSIKFQVSNSKFQATEGSPGEVGISNSKKITAEAQRCRVVFVSYFLFDVSYFILSEKTFYFAR